MSMYAFKIYKDFFKKTRSSKTVIKEAETKAEAWAEVCEENVGKIITYEGAISGTKLPHEPGHYPIRRGVA